MAPGRSRWWTRAYCRPDRGRRRRHRRQGGDLIGRHPAAAAHQVRAGGAPSGRGGRVHALRGRPCPAPRLGVPALAAVRVDRDRECRHGPHPGDDLLHEGRRGAVDADGHHPRRRGRGDDGLLHGDTAPEPPAVLAGHADPGRRVRALRQGAPRPPRSPRSPGSSRRPARRPACRPGRPAGRGGSPAGPPRIDRTGRGTRSRRPASPRTVPPMPPRTAGPGRTRSPIGGGSAAAGAASIALRDVPVPRRDREVHAPPEQPLGSGPVDPAGGEPLERGLVAGRRGDPGARPVEGEVRGGDRLRVLDEQARRPQAVRQVGALGLELRGESPIEHDGVPGGEGGAEEGGVHDDPIVPPPAARRPAPSRFGSGTGAWPGSAPLPGKAGAA